MNKQKLIEKWESAIEAAEFYGRGKEDRLIEYMRNFVDDLNQLDEPEVLSEEEEQTPETVADVIADFYKSLERLKEVLGMELKD